MRILHVIPTLAFGGAQRLVVDWAAEMLRAGYQADIAVLYQYENAFAKAAQAQGVRVVYLEGRLERYLSWHAFRLLHCVAQEYDILHAHLFPGQLYVAALPGCKVTTEHDTSNRRRGRFIWRLVDRCMYGRYDAICAISEGVKQALCCEVGIAPRRVQVVANGIRIVPPLPRDTTLRRMLGIPDEAIVVCKVARMEAPKKDHRLLIEAMARMQQSEHAGVYHTIFAGDGPARHNLEQVTDALGVRAAVHFVGMRSDVQTVLANSDIAVALATWEGFSLAALEAMAQGLPVIASDVPGLNEVVRHGETGLLVETHSVESLVAALRRLGQDSSLRATLGQAGRERAQLFSIHNSTRNYLNAYRLLVE